MSRHTDLAIEMRELKRTIDEREAELKPLKDRYDVIRKRDLLDAMTETGVSSMKLDDGGTFYISSKSRASVLAADQAQFHQWLRDNGFGALIKPVVNPATLDAWAREQRENGQPLPAMVSVYEEPLVAMRK